MNATTNEPRQSRPTAKSIMGSWLRMPGLRRYSSNVGWSLFGRLASLVISFFVTAYVVRSLGPTSYGYLSYAVSYVSIFSFIATIGIDQIVYRDLVRFPDKADELMGTAIGLRLIAGMIGTALCVTTAYLVSRDDVSFLLICVVSLTFVFNAAQIINYEFQARVESKYLAIISLITVVLLNALKVSVIFLNKGVIYLAFILLFEAILTGALLLGYRIRRYGSIRKWNLDRKIALLLLRDAWPMIFASAFSVIYARIDQVFIKHLINTSSVGIYDSAVRLSEIWYFIPATIVGIFFPALLNAKSVSPEAYTKRLAQAAMLLTGLAALISLPITLFAPQIIYIVYGPSFAAAVPILQIYVWSSVAMALGGLATSYLVAENKRKILFVSSCSTMVLNIILNMILIPRYGIIGSAWATFISYMAVSASLLFFKSTRSQIMSMLRVRDVLHTS